MTEPPSAVTVPTALMTDLMPSNGYTSSGSSRSPAAAALDATAPVASDAAPACRTRRRVGLGMVVLRAFKVVVGEGRRRVPFFKRRHTAPAFGLLLL